MSVNGVRSARGLLLLGSALGSIAATAAAQGHAFDPITMPAQGRASDPITMPAQGHASDPITRPAIIISQPGTPDSALDPSDVNGVGQMVVDLGGGYLGLCTGTLINPRTVLFAAHCVNESMAGGAQDPSGYGTNAGQIPIAFGFKADNRRAAWIWSGSGSGRHRTDTTNAIYNVNQVAYDADSLRLGLDQNFYQADVAVASLDTPAKGIPTWALLFSPLPAPGAISEDDGTGYHVTITGYGHNGTGITGSVGPIDFRRRVAENMIGMLGSLDDLDVGLSNPLSGLRQPLYLLDFDDPRRGTDAADPADYNLTKDRALPKEGMIGQGDSGGPLILDRTFDEKVVIGVLSGFRYYSAQQLGGYGNLAFYQPLYLYWDFIAANNPYRYVGATGGDGKWSDPAHWQTLVDPAYRVIVNGKLVNGVPTTAGAGIDGRGGSFGQACDQEPANGYDVCFDVKTRRYYVGGVERPDLGTPPADQAPAPAALPAPTLANGLPGATGFVPDNIDPDPAAHRAARYFDVTLSAAGTTTLDTAATIDKFTVAGSGARLSVAAAGRLTSLIEIDQLSGFVHVDGLVSTPGDYLLLAGQLSGSGRIDTPYLTSVSGVIAPGKVGTIGTLQIGGNLILASKNVLLVDVGAKGASDRLSISGVADLGGTVALAPVAGQRIRAGDTYTFLTADGGFAHDDGGRIHHFAAATPLSAILTPVLLYGDTSVSARIDAGRYADVVAPTRAQRAYAGLLDRERARQQQALSGIYDVLDLQDAPTIRRTLDGLAPRAEGLDRALGALALDNMARFYRARLGAADPRAVTDGQLTLAGDPVQLAAAELTRLPGQPPVASDTAAVTTRAAALPEDVAGYVAAGYLDGSATPTPSALGRRGRDPISGWYLVGGLETRVSDAALVGLGLSYTRATGTTALAGQGARGELYQGTLYGKLVGASGLYLDTQDSAGLWLHSTRRAADLAGSLSTLRSRDRALAISAEVGAGRDSTLGTLRFGPRVALRASQIDLGTSFETGGPAALRLDRHRYTSVQARAGVQLAGAGTVRPWGSLYAVHDFRDPTPLLDANFAAGLGPDARFALPGRDRDWGELGAGIAVDSGSATLSLGADTTLRRRDVRDRAYRASVRLRF
ncbi:autotransporter domain-containing protein [Sphingomonas sp. BK235]|uniref:autotransporter domain-containing protein n=1 Tax=Sphingomonas sp. BK235 TaxID=2512131 RepID=UPI0010EE2B71|nr:autotransporter domain-containing protein [Sphingomonas sp. BK235]TCP33782.1 autotransporter-like protein [Sphingomonas sp. BK235]